MKIAGIRELRAKSAHLLGGAEPVLVTRYGKVSGVYVPLQDPNRLPDDLRRELAATVGKQLAKALARQGVTEQRLAEDFDAYRQRRRGR
jgi:hypothetical protein